MNRAYLFFTLLLFVAGCGRQVDPLSKIPAEAHRVVTLDPYKLSKKLVDDRVQHGEYFELFDEATVQYLESRFLDVGRLIVHSDELGIRSFKNVYAYSVSYQQADYTGVLFSIGKEQHVHDLIAGTLKKEVKNKNGYRYALLTVRPGKQVLCTWYKDLLAFFFVEQGVGDLEEFLAWFTKLDVPVVEGDRVGAPDTELGVLQRPYADGEAVAWLDWLFPRATTYSALRFEDGEVVLASEHEVTADNLLLREPADYQAQFYHPDTALFRITLAADPVQLYAKMRQSDTVRAWLNRPDVQKNMDVERLVSLLSGDLSFSWQGERTVVRYHKKTVFDEEDFEMKIVTTKEERKVTDYVGYAGFHDRDSVMAYLDQLTAQGLFTKNGAVYTFVLGRDADLQVVVRERYLVLTNNPAYGEEPGNTRPAAFFARLEMEGMREDDRAAVPMVIGKLADTRIAGIRSLLTDSLDFVEVRVDKKTQKMYTSEITCGLVEKEVNSLLVLMALLSQVDVDGMLAVRKGREAVARR